MTSTNEHGWIGEAQVLVLPARPIEGSLADLSFVRRGAARKSRQFLAKKT
jgi:hypothetical protein